MEINNLKKNVNFRQKSFSDRGWILTFNDILTLPGYTSFKPSECDISTNLGPFHFESPIISASMDTVTEEDMAANTGAAQHQRILQKCESLDTRAKEIRRPQPFP